MGTVRTLLAISVVLVHTPVGAVMADGQLAVQVFFCISGFLMTYILQNVPAYSSSKRFYQNRALRLYPTYWACALLTVAFLAVEEMVFHHSRLSGFWKLPLAGQLLLAISNLALFGQDLVMFIGLNDNHQMIFLTDFTRSDSQLWTFLLVPPAWTLGVELCFYAIAPIVVRRLWVVVAVLTFSVVIRAIGIAHGLSRDPWDYRFFPFELRLFLLGSLSCHLNSKLSLDTFFARRGPQIAGYAIMVSLILLSSWARFELYPNAILLATFLALPALFHFQQFHPFDSWVGELSYPVYVGHWLVLGLASELRSLAGSARHNQVLFSVAEVIGSLIFAYLLKRLVADRVEVARRAIRQRAAPMDAATERPERVRL